MILDALLGILSALVSGLLALLPPIPTPEWFDSIGATLSTALGYIGGLGAWIPLALAGQVFVFVLACIGIGFVIKVIRMIASYLTAGGGSAG